MSTTAPIGDFCQRCYSYPCRCGQPSYTPPSSQPDWFVQQQITGLLVDITKHLAELAEVVHKIAEKLDAEK